MSVSNPQNGAQVEYTLPGIMHYLQKETTKNERDRIQWESERGELKANISKLEGDKKSLTEEVGRLKTELKSLKRNSGAGGGTKMNKDEVSKLQFNEIDINPLAVARERLQSQIREIGVLLNATPVDLSKLDLNDGRAFFSSNPTQHNAECTAESSLNSNKVIPKTEQTPDPAATSKAFSIPTPESAPESPLLSNSISDFTANDFTPETHDSTESDAETVIDESIGGLKRSRSLSHHSIQKFMLTSHASTITSLSFNETEFLGASEDGVIKLWTMQDILNSEGELQPSKTYRGDPTAIKFVKWINKTWFVTTSDIGVKFWKKDSLKASSKFDVNGIKSFDTNGSYIAYTTLDGNWSVSALTCNTNSIRYQQHIKLPAGKCDFVAFDPKNKDTLFKVIDNSVERLNLKDSKSVTLVLSNLDLSKGQITHFSIEGGLWSFLFDGGEVLLYNIEKKSIVFQQKYHVEVASVKVNEKHIVVFLTNGDIKVYENKKTSEIFKEFNIYQIFFQNHSNFKEEDKATLNHSVIVGDLLWKDYVFVGCEDSMIRGFELR